jgi:hypothetical protein
VTWVASPPGVQLWGLSLGVCVQKSAVSLACHTHEWQQAAHQRGMGALAKRPCLSPHMVAHFGQAQGDTGEVLLGSGLVALKQTLSAHAWLSAGCGGAGGGRGRCLCSTPFLLSCHPPNSSASMGVWVGGCVIIMMQSAGGLAPDYLNF